MKQEHCFFKTSYGTVTLHPNRGAQCAVNGMECKDPVILKQGMQLKLILLRFALPLHQSLKIYRNILYC